MINWIDDKSFEIDGYKVTMDYAFGGSTRQSTSQDFTMMKAKDYVDQYLSLATSGYKNVLEVGIYQGGSFVFLDRLLKPDRIAGIELSQTPIPALDAYVRQHKDRARLYYGTSQDDVARVSQIIRRDFNGQLDLVVDDASHFYESTKATVVTAFPCLRPGGLYIIEDWCWSFEPEFQNPTDGWQKQNALCNLMIDLMEEMVLGRMIAAIQVVRSMLKITRSDAPATPMFTKHARRGRDVVLL